VTGPVEGEALRGHFPRRTPTGWCGLIDVRPDGYAALLCERRDAGAMAATPKKRRRLHRRAPEYHRGRARSTNTRSAFLARDGQTWFAKGAPHPGRGVQQLLPVLFCANPNTGG